MIRESKKAAENTSQEKKSVETVSQHRLLILMAILLLAIALITAKLFSVQAIHSQSYKKKAKQQQIREVEIKAPRGNILDRDNGKLARSVRGYSFAIDPSYLKILVAYKEAKGSMSLVNLESLVNVPSIKEKVKKEQHRLASVFAETFGKSKEYYLKKIDRDDQFVWIERHVPISTSKKILALNHRAIRVFKEEIRQYENLAGQLIGVINIDGTGLSGLEKSWDTLLSGREGVYVLERALLGHSRLSLESYQKPPLRGGSLELTLDTKIQGILEDELNKGIKKVNASSGFGAVMDVKTGEILAMASSPSFDMNTRRGFSSKTEKNFLITESLEPGSTFKLVVLATAIENMLVNEDKKFFAENGTYKIYDRVVKDHKKYTYLTLKDAVAHSSNIVMAKLSQKLPSHLFYEQAKKFGFGKKTGINIPGESSGKLKPPSQWSGITKAWMSQGYEVQATPIQILSAYATIANGGIRMKPFVIRSAMSRDGKELYKEKASEIGRVVSKRTAKKITEYLQAVVDSGTGVAAKISGLGVAGKTGTAQRYVSGTYQSGSYFSSFAGFFPAESPKYAMIIGVNTSTKDYYASLSAAPVFGNVGSRIISCIDEKLRYALLSKKKKAAKKQTIDNLPKKTIVPFLRGLSSEEAISILRFHGLDYSKKEIKEVSKNKVIAFVQSQGIPPGKTVPVWTKIPLRFTQKGKMPNLKGLRTDRAISIASKLDLSVNVVGHGSEIVDQWPKKETAIKKPMSCKLTLR